MPESPIVNAPDLGEIVMDTNFFRLGAEAC